MEMQFSMDRTLMAKYALIIYGYERTGYEEARSIEHYIVKHRIDEQGRFLEGAPLTRNALQKICSLVIPSFNAPEYFSDRVLACCPGVILWWVPAAPRRVFFTKETGPRSGVYPLPATLFLVADRTLYTWALSVAERPAPSTPIYHSPLFNVYEDGRCCMGNVNLPQHASPGNINEWEEAFFDGACNGHIPPTLQGIDPRDLWKAIKGKKEFPKKYLISCGCVEDVIQSIAKRRI